MDEEEQAPSQGPNLSFPTILHLFDPSTSSNPELAKHLQHELQQLQAAPEAWGLIAGLSTHDDPNVRFFSAHTAQVKISRDWATLPAELQPALLALILETLSTAINPMSHLTYQPANGVVIRKLFGCLASLILRLPFYLFPHPILTVLQTVASAAAVATSLPPQHRLRDTTPPADLLGTHALRRHLEGDLPAVMSTITEAMSSHIQGGNLELQEERLREAEAACRCAESWVDYGLGADELNALVPSLYSLLPLAAASSTLVEVLSESIWRFGKGTKVLTEPLVAWVIGPGQSLIAATEGEPSDEVIGFAKLLAALVEHSSEWLVARLGQSDVQAFLGTILRITGWQGSGGVDEAVSETSPEWTIAKDLFRELITVTRAKVRWPGSGESSDGLGGMDREEREAFDCWRRDAGEVIVCAYYIVRDEMLQSLTHLVAEQLQGAPWQDIEATLHCIRYSSEAVPLGEDTSLPVLFGEQILGRLSTRPLHGRGEERLRLTVVSMIQSYEEWFKFHPDHLLPVLNYLVPSLSSTHHISRSAADALKALCDICRNKLVQHIGAFSDLHGKIGDLGTKVIQAITSVIQALSPPDAIGPVEPALVQSMNALAACFKGLSPSDDDMFDLDDGDETTDKAAAVAAARSDPTMLSLRGRIESAITAVVQSISSLVKHSTLSSSDTLISLSPLPLLTLVTTAAERFPSALWMSLASTLTLRINSPPSPLTAKKDKTQAEEEAHTHEEHERWEIVADAAGRLVVVAGGLIGVEGGIRDHPDVVEGWFKFCSAVSSRFPGVLLRLPTHIIEAYMSLGVMGLAAHERFSLTTASGFFVALLATTRFPSPLEPIADTLLKHFGPQILRALLLSAGSEGPRSVIPNLAELLASLVVRVPGEDMASWLNAILAEEGFPDARATSEAKARLKTAVLRSRTTKKMREALHEFALVARGLDNTTYGNATAI
ncbi:hypothetical protein EHS25_002053 [Saitozyma podzolica]|uniref:Importin N-terminal domain-containing protein n=1 Tax=Saitozyma podzolica TaxID=1890683 RepID=A0A427YEQ0_9TREE|nr:hypothetical protein EHS25_002053 [Saitozyma podzolica]